LSGGHLGLHRRPGRAHPEAGLLPQPPPLLGEALVRQRALQPQLVPGVVRRLQRLRQGEPVEHALDGSGPAPALLLHQRLRLFARLGQRLFGPLRPLRLRRRRALGGRLALRRLRSRRLLRGRGLLGLRPLLLLPRQPPFAASHWSTLAASRSMPMLRYSFRAFTAYSLACAASPRMPRFTCARSKRTSAANTGSSGASSSARSRYETAFLPFPIPDQARPSQR